MRRFFFGVAACLLVGAVGSAGGQEAGTVDNPVQLPDSIVIIANRKPTPVREIASQVTVITRADIQSGQATNAADLLRSVEGLEVVQSGGPGHATSVFLRGANSHHTLVLIDGVQMNDPASPNGAFDFAGIGVDNIERIEILHGSHAVLYGSKAIGGVISITTRNGLGRPNVELQTEAGTYNSYGESVIVSGGVERLNYAASLSRRDSDGFSAAAKRLGGKEKDGYSQTAGSLHLRLRPGEQLQFSLVGRVHDVKADIDNSYGILDDPNYVNNSTTGSLALNLERQEKGSMWIPRVSLSYSRHHLESINDPDEAHPGELNRFDSHGERFNAEALETFSLINGQTLSTGLEAEHEQYHSEYFDQTPWSAYGDTVSEVSATTVSGFALYEIAAGSRWFNTLGIRFDHHNMFGGITSCRVTSAYLVGDGSLKLKGSYGTGFKAPSLMQMHHQLYGNPALLPEESKSWEFGFETMLRSDVKRASFGLTYFAEEFTNLIASDPYTFRSVNIGQAQSRGIEGTAEFSGEGYRTALNITFTKPKDKTNGTPIIRRPEFKINLAVRRDLSERIQLSADFLRVGDRKDYNFNAWPYELVTLDPYTLVGVGANYRLSARLSLHGRIENLLNQEYEEVYGYTTPSRSFFAGVKATL